jgi:signal transduction histidine kinase
MSTAPRQRPPSRHHDPQREGTLREEGSGPRAAHASGGNGHAERPFPASDPEILEEIGHALAEAGARDEVLALVRRAAEAIVEGPYAAIALPGPDGAGLTVTSASDALRGLLGTTVREDGVGIAPVEEGAPQAPRPALEVTGWPREAAPPFSATLESRGRPIGLLLAARERDAAPPAAETVAKLRALALHASVVIDNLRLEEEVAALTEAAERLSRQLESAYRDIAAGHERLLISEKLAGLGRVTAGIAHEINSPLGSILTCLQLATSYAQEYRASSLDPDVRPQDHLGIAEDMLETLALAENATRRVAHFVRTIKGQTRMEGDRISAFNPAEEVDCTLLLLRHALTDGRVEVSLDLDRSLALRGDRTKFTVIVQNLVSNAVDACEERPGEVRVRLFRSGDSAVLEVADSGCGIAPEIRSRIYDYLFTTKEVGRGTGLGLSLVHDIVTSHFRGSIDFQSDPGFGTTFMVALPLEHAS